MVKDVKKDISYRDGSSNSVLENVICSFQPEMET